MSVNRDHELRPYYECGQLVRDRRRPVEEEEEILYGCDRDEPDEDEDEEEDEEDEEDEEVE